MRRPGHGWCGLIALRLDYFTTPNTPTDQAHGSLQNGAGDKNFELRNRYLFGQRGCRLFWGAGQGIRSSLPRGRVESRRKAGAGIEPADGAFAELCLTTWLPRHFPQRFGLPGARESLSIHDRPTIDNNCLHSIAHGRRWIIRRSISETLPAASRARIRISLRPGRRVKDSVQRPAPVTGR